MSPVGGRVGPRKERARERRQETEGWVRGRAAEWEVRPGAATVRPLRVTSDAAKRGAPAERREVVSEGETKEVM
jgi:hypothetical protein